MINNMIIAIMINPILKNMNIRDKHPGKNTCPIRNKTNQLPSDKFIDLI